MDYRTVLTTCTYCGCGCNFFLEVLDGKAVGTIPCKTSPVNEGKLCIKGWNVHEFIHNEKRLKKPLLRKNGNLVEVSWDEALDFTAARLKEIKEKSGPDSIGFLTSAKVTNEENYVLQKFARAAVNTNNVDHCARLWHSSTVAGLAAAFGSGAMTNSIEEFEKADCIFIIGSNTSVAHPLIATRIYRAKKNGAKIIVADPRRVHISEIADRYVRQKMGTDVALLNGIMHVILASGWHDQAFIDERTEEFDQFKKSIEAYPPEKAAEICGVSAEDIRWIAECYGKAEKASLVYCMGITQHTTGVDNVKSLANLAMLTGNLGKESSGVNPLRGQNNVQGACDMGGLPNVFTAYQPVTSSAASEKFAKAWGVEKLSQNVGLTIPGMLEGLENQTVKALFILGENPVVSDPDVHHVKKALEKAELLVVQDIFFTATAELADVVLPGVSFAEKDGTFSNTERRVSRVRQAVEPVGDARQDWQIIQDISNRFGYPMNYSSPEDIFTEIASLTPSYAGITYPRLEGDGLQWPCPTTEHAGTRFLHKDKIARGKGLFHAVEFKAPAEIVDEQYPFWLSTGRVFAHYHTGTMTRNSPTLDAEIEEGFLELNVDDAAKISVKQGDWVTLTSRRGTIDVKAMLTKRIAQGSVFMPFHFIESCANILTNPAHDPICKIPELKVCAVNVVKRVS